MGESLLTTIQSAAEPVSWVLIHSLWVGGMIAILLAVSMSLMKSRAPQLRYALAGLALVLVLPASVSIVVYDSMDRNLPVYSEATAETGMSEKAYSPVATVTPQQNGATIWTRLAEIQNVRPDKAAPWIFLTWMLGISGMTIYHLAGWKRARSLTQSNSYPVSERWQRRFIQLCGRSGIGRSPELLSSSLVKMPCVIGWVKPVILLPVSVFTGLSTEDIDMILVHELAHVHRHDVLINYAQTAVETLLFFNPAIWWISKQIRAERENCCDDMAVAIMDDRLAYARALTNLEGLRSVRPRLAPAADGASLVKRVRRLLGENTTVPRWPGIRAATALSLAALLTVSFSLFTTLSSVNAADDKDANIATIYQEKDDDLHGYWNTDSYDKGMSLTMQFGRRGRCSFEVEPEDMLGFAEGSDVQFQVVRDAGTFFFVGDVEKNGRDYYGEGDCHFRANPEYLNEMKKLGFRVGRSLDALTLAVLDVSLSFARGVVDAGYGGITFDRLTEWHIHGVTPELIAELKELGYSDLDPEDLVSMRIHRVTPKYIKELRESGYSDLDPEELVEMRIHRVDPEYVRKLANLGLRGLRQSKLVEMSIHGVSTYYIEDLQELGFNDLSPDRLVEMRIHDVEAGYVKDLIELGFKDLTPSDLVAMKIHGVSVEFIEELIKRGYDDLSPDELVELKIHGLDRKRSRSSRSY